MCEFEICACRWHSMKISNAFVDILDETFPIQEEQDLLDQIRDEGGL